MISPIQEEWEMDTVSNSPTLIYEGNITCITQLIERYIKVGRTKHLSPKLFFTHDIPKEGKINI